MKPKEGGFLEQVKKYGFEESQSYHQIRKNCVAIYKALADTFRRNGLLIVDPNQDKNEDESGYPTLSELLSMTHPSKRVTRTMGSVSLLKCNNLATL